MKKVFFLFSLFALLATLGLSSVIDYIPQDASLVMIMQNNAENYAKLKTIGIFGFMLSDFQLETLLTQQIDTFQYTNESFVPSEFWGALGGDIALFVTGEVNFDKLLSLGEDIQANPESALNMMDPTAAMDDLEGVLDQMDFCVIVTPAVSPDLVLKSWGALFETKLTWGYNESLGMYLQKDNETMLLSLNQKSIDLALSAKQNNIRNNPNFQALYSKKDWMFFYSKPNTDMQSMMSGMEEELGITIDPSWFDKVELGYLFGRVTVQNALVAEMHNQYIYADQQLKDLAVNSLVDVYNLVKGVKLPGFAKGIMQVDMPQWFSFLKPLADDILSQMLSSEEEKDIANQVEGIMESLTGDARFGVDMNISDTGETTVDLYGSLGMTKTSGLKELIEDEGGETLKTIGNANYSQIMSRANAESMDLFMVLNPDSLEITTFSPGSIKEKLSTYPAMDTSATLMEMIDAYSMKKAYGVLFVDISDVLVKLLGMPYPSGVFSEVGVDMEGNSRLLLVIK
ncbi:MAG TPA: hypothetical protein P5560_01740 [Thermotogota bacterium]|nr:hypothetical protein [Thermotogota bacterium]HRW91650.1 hypothetical protein [Thermotogota bacterium]